LAERAESDDDDLCALWLHDRRPSEASMTEQRHHSILLSYARELRFDVANGVVRVAYYTPDMPKDKARTLARKAFEGDITAIAKLQAAGKQRTVAQGRTLGEALRHARNLDAEDRECREVQAYADRMNWLEGSAA
jgi:hypothetical protein